MQRPPKKHHYIPRFYLAGFTLSGSKDDFIWVLDQKNGKQWRAKAHNVAYQNDFYTLDIPETEPESIEKEFSFLEGQAASVIKTIINTKSIPTGESYNVLMNFIALTIARVPSTRKTLEEPFMKISEKILKIALASPERYHTLMERLKKKGYDISDAPYDSMLDFLRKKEYELEFNNTFHIQNLLIVMDSVLPYLVNRNWVLVEATEAYFICSDRPVTLHWTNPRDSFYGPGFGMKETNVIFPVNKNLLLLGRFEEIKKNHTKISREGVAWLNSLTLMQAMQYIFSPEKDFIYLSRELQVSDSSVLLQRIQKRSKMNK
ncbi:MAG TPA: DUF4238 domain-containing protein [Clostridia bacterium]